MGPEAERDHGQERSTSVRNLIALFCISLLHFLTFISSVMQLKEVYL
jgi:hypothetical protein